jgi:DNA/RNA endonuclease YhcR with UshA esterase domain
MKKLLVLLLALVLCVGTLASCDFNFKGETTTPAETTPEVTTPAETTPEETTPEATTPEETTPENTTPEETTPGDGPEVPPEDDGYDVEAAADYIYNLYKNKEITAADFEVTAKVAIAGVVHTVEWSVDTDKVVIKTNPENANVFIVDVNETSVEEVAYVLTATITGGDKTATKSFNLIVPKFEVTAFEDYIDATEGTVTVAGIVVGINSKAAGNTRNHLFLADLDGKGGYYSYQMDQDPVADLGIELGMIVAVTGPVAPYSGMQEIKGGVAVILDETKHDFAPVDITELVLSGASLKNYVGLPVTINGVEIANQELGGTSDYLKFKIGNLTSYIRTYVTDFPTTLVRDDKATIDAAHAEHFGWNANVTGILVLYSGAPYLIPTSVNCFEYLSAPQKTDAEKVTDALGLLTFGSSFSSDTVIDLPAASTAFADVLLTWTSNSEFAVVADGKLTITVPDAATEVVITVTATCGEATGTKEFTAKLSKTATPVKDIIDLGASMAHNTYTESKYLVAGIITEVYNTQYGNMKITDENGNILTIYGTYSADGSLRYDAMESKPVVGDYVVIFGVVGQYNGTPQVKNGWIMSFTAPTSVKDAIDTGASMEHNTYT